jgi:hypothetical protein
MSLKIQKTFLIIAVLSTNWCFAEVVCSRPQMLMDCTTARPCLYGTSCDGGIGKVYLLGSQKTESMDITYTLSSGGAGNFTLDKSSCTLDSIFMNFNCADLNEQLKLRGAAYDREEKVYEGAPLKVHFKDLVSYCSSNDKDGLSKAFIESCYSKLMPSHGSNPNLPASTSGARNAN